MRTYLHFIKRGSVTLQQTQGTYPHNQVIHPKNLSLSHPKPKHYIKILGLFFTPKFSLRRDCQKLPMPTIFQVVMAGYWEKFSISNNRASD